jgi:magnesium-transporting ATPase (P-type)
VVAKRRADGNEYDDEGIYERIEQARMIEALEAKFRAELQKGQILVCTFGLQDSKRDQVETTLDDIVATATFPRIVSGDHRMAVKKCAMACNLIEDDEEGMYSGEWFEENVASQMESVKAPDGRTTYKFVSDSARRYFRNNYAKTVKILYRADPSHKHMLVSALKFSGGCVAVVGESISDATSIVEADVGMVMGQSGCQISIKTANIIFTNDDISSLHTSCRWGRNIYDSIKKFLQFQMTVNIAVCLTVLLGAVSLG